MGHADAELFDAKAWGLLNKFHHHGDQAFASVQAKSLFAPVPGVQEFFEDIGVDQITQNPLSQLGIKGRPVLHGLHALLQPPSAFSILDMHVLSANGAAIRAFKMSNDVTKASRTVKWQVSGIKRLIKVCLTEPKRFQIQ